MGTLDMIRRCSDACLPAPEFTDSSGFKATIWRETPPEQVKVQPEFLHGDLKSKVINLLADGPMSRFRIVQEIRTEEGIRSTLQRYSRASG